MWDMGTFVDENGTAYLLLHEGDIYRLSDDDLTAVEKVAENIAPGGESPAMFRHGDNYFMMFSNKTSWERNDNYYFVSSSLHGPWKEQGLFCPEGSLTYNSQCSFVFTLEADGRNSTDLYGRSLVISSSKLQVPHRFGCPSQLKKTHAPFLNIGRYGRVNRFLGFSLKEWMNIFAISFKWARRFSLLCL